MLYTRITSNLKKTNITVSYPKKLWFNWFKVGPQAQISFGGSCSEKLVILLLKLFTMEIFKYIQTYWDCFNEPQIPITKLQWLSIFCQFCIIYSPNPQYLKNSVGIFYSKSTLELKKKIIPHVIILYSQYWEPHENFENIFQITKEK